MSCCDSNALLKNWEKPEPENRFETGLKVSNSLTGTKVAFLPNEGNTVNWYGCGPTVYDAPHMGHARNYVSFDVIRRVMEDYFGYKVNMCMNITDIDDKIICRANELGIPFEQLSRFWENDFFIHMRKLKCRLPDVVTRVSEFIPEIIVFIENIIKNGYAYESAGSVYFNTNGFRSNPKHIYGRMEPWSVNDEARVLEGEGSLCIATEKKSPLDFALWKRAKADEPSWGSPWGNGRPGWHIECSAMASQVLGFPLDVHSGGIDLRFPHHDNELAQSEAEADRPQWVNYFLHSGHLHIKGLKMSKSLKNFITIKDIVETYPARVVRILTLIHKWDQPMNYDSEGSSMIEPMEIDRVFTHFFERMAQLLRKGLKCEQELYMTPSDVQIDSATGLNATQKWEDHERKLQGVWEKAQSTIHGALCDNFNTPLVMTTLQELISATNMYVRNKNEVALRGPLLAKVTKYVYDIVKMFGLTTDDDYELAYATKAIADGESFSTLMDQVGEFRHQMRELSRDLLKMEDSGTKAIGESLLNLSDRFRDESLVNLGVRLEDKGDKGFMWKQSNKADILRERERKLEEDQAAREAKAKRQREQAETLAKKTALSLIPPHEYFKTTRGDEFVEYDDEGIPLKLIDGQAVSKSQRDKMKKALEKHIVAYAKSAQNV